MERHDYPGFSSTTTTAQNSTAPTRQNSTDNLHCLHLLSRPGDKSSRERDIDLQRIALRPIVSKPGLDTPDESINNEVHRRHSISIRERMLHFTWAWFTFPMSCGGISLLIYMQPHQFQGLKTIGMVLYALNLFIFTSICLGLVTRFILHPGSLTKSLLHPREGFFFPTFFLAIATIITTTQRYAIPENNVPTVWATKAIFWIYLTFTFILAVGQYTYLFDSHSFKLQSMMPSWILPIFPVMLTGTIATVILDAQDNISPMAIITAGLTCQGLGFSVSFMMYAHMIGRLMESGLPNREHRPALFMCVGPPAFTALALIGLANKIPQTLTSTDSISTHVDTIRTVALLAAVFMWTISLWWFCIATISIIASPPKYFHLGTWAMVFPNTGFTLATISIGNEFQSEAILWVATAMSIIVITVFIGVFVWLIRAVYIQDIMYPGRDEDVTDH